MQGSAMADRIEREINEILEKLDSLPDEGAERRPISIADHREKRPKQRVPEPAKAPRQLPSFIPTPTHALLAGAGTVIGGLVLANLWAPLIWAAFAGVAMFIGGFVAALVRKPNVPRGGASGSPNQPGGVFWRDRYISYEPTNQTTWQKIRRRFRG
jgi:hypothetical protein